MTNKFKNLSKDEQKELCKKWFKLIDNAPDNKDIQITNPITKRKITYNRSKKPSAAFKKNHKLCKEYYRNIKSKSEPESKQEPEKKKKKKKKKKIAVTPSPKNPKSPKSILNVKDYEKRETNNEGACLFNAVVGFLTFEKEKRFIDVGSQEEEDKAMKLRKKVVKFLKKNAKNKYPQFQGMTIKKYIETEDENEKIKFKTYIEKMKKINEWGGQPEVSALSIMKKRSIHIYRLDGNKYIRAGIGAEYPNSKKKPITLFYNQRTVEEEGNHFEYLVKKSKIPKSLKKLKQSISPKLDIPEDIPADIVPDETEIDFDAMPSDVELTASPPNVVPSPVKTPKQDLPTPKKVESPVVIKKDSPLSVDTDLSVSSIPSNVATPEPDFKVDKNKYKEYEKIRNKVLKTRNINDLEKIREKINKIFKIKELSQKDHIRKELQIMYPEFSADIKTRDEKQLLKDAKDNGINTLRERLLRILDKSLSQTWNYISYPHVSDKDFYKKIYMKKEFYQNIYQYPFEAIEEAEDEDRMKKVCPGRDSKFKLTSYQIFLKNYMNFTTPYNSLLLFHGLGSGKSCSAISIAETYKKTFTTNFKRILVLVSGPTINENFRQEIHNIARDYNQCTFSEYINYYPRDSPDIKKKKSDILINKYYEIDHYQRFANKFNKAKKELGREEFKKWISTNYSNRVVIIDEVHNLKIHDKLDVENKTMKRYEAVEHMVRFANNIKLILLSGTPMYHEPTEIISLLNLMLINDNYKPISKKQFFKGNDLYNIKEFRKITKGYISYIRKENPLTFPKRLYPKKSVEVSDYIFNKFKFTQELRNIRNVMDDAKTYIIPCVLKDTQKKNYIKLVDKMDSDKEKPTESALTEMLLYDSIEFPLNRIILDRYNKDNELEDMSIKIYKLIKHIIDNPSKGPIFIYSNYIQKGIIPLSLALIANGIEIAGYENGKPNNLTRTARASAARIKLPDVSDLKVSEKDKICYKCAKTKENCKHKPFIPMRFEIISGGTEQREEIRNTFNGFDPRPGKQDILNIEGQQIKILIGSSVLREGINLKNVREIHIMDPWHNKSRTDQVVGRGLRFCSHVLLPKKERNIKIYQYAATLTDPKNNYNYKDYNEKKIEKFLDQEFNKGQEIGQTISIELTRRPKQNGKRRTDLEPLLTYDIVMYKRGEILDEKNKKVEKVLKETAIDCMINNEFNKPEEQDYKCDVDLKNVKIELDTSTFENIFLDPYIEYTISLIKDLFKKNKSDIIYEKQILNIPQFNNEEIFQSNIGTYIIKKALYELTPKKNDLTTFYHIFELPNDGGKKYGYILPRMLKKDNEIVYIFQEMDPNTKLRSKLEELPMYHRRGIYKSIAPSLFSANKTIDKNIFNIFKGKHSGHIKNKSNMITITTEQTKKIIDTYYKQYPESYKKEAKILVYQFGNIPSFWIKEWKSTKRVLQRRDISSGKNCENYNKNTQLKNICKIIIKRIKELNNEDGKEFNNLLKDINKSKKSNKTPMSEKLCNLILKSAKKAHELEKGAKVWYRKYPMS